MATRSVTEQLKIRQKVELGKRHGLIAKEGRLLIGPRTFLQSNVAVYGPRKVIPASSTIAARFRKPGEPEVKSTIVGAGEAPAGFGKQVLWHPGDASLALAVFLNAGDYLGVSISGVRPTDTIEFVSATGVASFAEDDENEGVGAFIGIVGAGLSLGASAFGAPELAPVIGAATKFAEDRFQEKKVKTKRRDPFGEDPGSGHKAREEGGVIVSLPEARQIYYSGDGDHKDRWIKEPGIRDEMHLPEHVKHAYFLRSDSSNRRTAGAEGDFIISPWDWFFTDNFGYYRLNVLVKRGSGETPVVD